MTFEEWLEKSDLAVTDLQRNCMKLGWDACAAEMKAAKESRIRSEGADTTKHPTSKAYTEYAFKIGAMSFDELVLELEKQDVVSDATSSLGMRSDLLSAFYDMRSDLLSAFYKGTKP